MPRQCPVSLTALPQTRQSCRSTARPTHWVAAWKSRSPTRLVATAFASTLSTMLVCAPHLYDLVVGQPGPGVYDPKLPLTGPMYTLKGRLSDPGTAPCWSSFPAARCLTPLCRHFGDARRRLVRHHEQGDTTLFCSSPCRGRSLTIVSTAPERPAVLTRCQVGGADQGVGQCAAAGATRNLSCTSVSLSMMCLICCRSPALGSMTRRCQSPALRTACMAASVSTCHPAASPACLLVC